MVVFLSDQLKTERNGSDQFSLLLHWSSPPGFDKEGLVQIYYSHTILNLSNNYRFIN